MSEPTIETQLEIIPQTEPPTDTTVTAPSPDDKPAKRHRRTKAEMEAARAASEVPGPIESEELRRETAPTKAEPPALATPLQGLHNLVEQSPFTWEEFEKFLISDMEIEPSEKLEQLSDDRLKKFIVRFGAAVARLNKETKKNGRTS